MSKNPFDDTPESFGRFYADDDQRMSSRISEDDPFSSTFSSPAAGDAKSLLRYMLAQQQEVFGQTILDGFSYAIMLRGAKACSGEYPPELIYRAIKLAVQWANHPFTFKFVRERTIPEVIKQCPHLPTTIAGDLPTTAAKSRTKKPSDKK